jgi:hypothetical protein
MLPEDAEQLYADIIDGYDREVYQIKISRNSVEILFMDVDITETVQSQNLQSRATEIFTDAEERTESTIETVELQERLLTYHIKIADDLRLFQNLQQYLSGVFGKRVKITTGTLEKEVMSENKFQFVISHDTELQNKIRDLRDYSLQKSETDKMKIMWEPWEYPKVINNTLELYLSSVFSDTEFPFRGRVYHLSYSIDMRPSCKQTEAEVVVSEAY